MIKLDIKLLKAIPIFNKLNSSEILSLQEISSEPLANYQNQPTILSHRDFFNLKNCYEDKLGCL